MARGGHLKEKREVDQGKIVETAEIAVLVRAKVAVLRVVADTTVLIGAKKLILMKLIIIKMWVLESLRKKNTGNLVKTQTPVMLEEMGILNHLVKRERLEENLAPDPLLTGVKPNLVKNTDLAQDLVTSIQAMVLATVGEAEMKEEVFVVVEMMIGVNERMKEEEGDHVQNQEKGVVRSQGKGRELVQGLGIVNVIAVTVVAAEIASDLWI